MRAAHIRIFLILFILSVTGFGSEHRNGIVPPYEVIQTKNGVPVYYFPNSYIPIFQVELVYEQGSDLDPEGFSGLSFFTGSMIRRGSIKYDENQIADQLDDLATNIEVNVGEDRTSISTYGLNENAFSIVELFFHLITSPTFPQAPFKRIKHNHLDQLSRVEDHPSLMASYTLDLLLFNGTSKARPTSGIREDLQKIELAKIREFYPKLFRTDRLKVLVIGGKYKSDILDKVVSKVEALPCPACKQPVSKAKTWTYSKWQVSPGDLLLLKKSGLPQSHIRMGFIGPKRRTPEYYDLRVAETILSGNFASRLNSVLREKLNLTYSVDASFNFGQETGTFIVSTATRNDKVGILIRETRKMLQEFASGDIEEAELQTAKDYLIGSFPLSLQNSYAIANTFFVGMLNELDPNFLNRYEQRIGNVSLESIRKAISKYFKLDQMRTVIVGDPDQVGPRLRAEKINFVIRNPKDYL